MKISSLAGWIDFSKNLGNIVLQILLLVCVVCSLLGLGEENSKLRLVAFGSAVLGVGFWLGDKLVCLVAEELMQTVPLLLIMSWLPSAFCAVIILLAQKNKKVSEKNVGIFLLVLSIGLIAGEISSAWLLSPT